MRDLVCLFIFTPALACEIRLPPRKIQAKVQAQVLA